MRVELFPVEDFGHADFWEEVLAHVLAEKWQPEVSQRFTTVEQLRDELLPLAYAFPRGRVVSLGRTFAVYHGDNLAAFMQSDRKAIEASFASLRPLAAPRLLRELSALAPAPGVISRHVRTLNDMVEMARTLERTQELPTCESVRQLIGHHDQLAAELNRQGLAELEDMKFPPPPIPGHETIVPLTAPVLLLEEGRLQQNCVASYVRRVAGGNEFIYRVLAPERATLQIVRGRRGWQIGQLSGPRNHPVSSTTRISVEHWIQGDGWDEAWTPF